MAQPSGEVFPPLTSTATTSNSRIPAAMEMIDDILPQPLEQGLKNSFMATVVEVDTSEDILEELLPYAAEDEIFILAAIGKVSYIELANPYKDPVPNTVLRGNFEISSIEGNIVWPKHHEKNKKSEVSVLVVGNDGLIRGGPVRTLIAKSPVKVMISTTNKNVIQNMASKEYEKENEVSLFQFLDQAKRMEEVKDQIYKTTLKELNQTN
ncbi:hypothetical protein PHAVU_002G118500 [Phaseolus vulgaris]|uniref:AT-hook motif nuclear-localized protein n=1 Tax=Phaseolus vulgaris TaxID=3885 RepID=V7CIJ7_PHAVU|nr:hypothetical protein PHAVU_002G118500g [Phaseolus vulgaris]ESW30027.1 hypothetical protein PHAVU_002G118500g [Phaseolus vulgaris]